MTPEPRGGRRQQEPATKARLHVFKYSAGVETVTGGPLVDLAEDSGPTRKGRRRRGRRKGRGVRRQGSGGCAALGRSWAVEKRVHVDRLMGEP